MALSERILAGRGLLITFVTFALGGALAGVLYVLFGRSVGALPPTGVLGELFPVVFNGLAGIAIGVLCAVGELIIVLLTRKSARPILGVLGSAAAAGLIAIALISIGSMGTHPSLALGGGVVFFLIAVVGLIATRLAVQDAQG
jgi:hypothetical protein